MSIIFQYTRYFQLCNRIYIEYIGKIMKLDFILLTIISPVPFSLGCSMLEKT